MIEADEYTVTPDVAVPTGGSTGGSVVVKQLGGLLSRSDPVEVNLVCNFLTAPNPANIHRYNPDGSENANYPPFALLLFSWSYVEGNNAIYNYGVTDTPPGVILDINLVTNVDSYYDSSTGVARSMVSLHTDRHDSLQYKCEVFLNNHHFAFDKFQLVFEAPQLRIMLHESGQDDLDVLITDGTLIADSQEEGYLVAPEVDDGSHFIIGEVSLPQDSAFLTLTHNGNELGIRTEEVDEQVFIVSDDPVDLSTGSNEIIFEVKEGACVVHDAEAAAAAIAADPDVTADDYPIEASAWNAECTTVYDSIGSSYTLSYSRP